MKKWVLLIAIGAFLAGTYRVADSAPVLGPGVNVHRVNLLRAGVGFDRLTNRDYDAIAGAGFRSIRQPVAANVFLGTDCEMAAKARADLIRAATAAAAHGLTYIIDFHPRHDKERRLLSSTQGMACLKRAWRYLATRLQGQLPNVAFEIMNEPFGANAKESWWGEQFEIVKAVRSADERRIILASAAQYDSAESLVENRPYPIPNVVYVFHDYKPRSFTAQGRDGGANESYTVARGMRWLSPSVKTAAGVKRTYSTFPELDAVARWAQQNGVRIFCGEFGVYRDGGVVNEDRLNYYKAITQKLDSLHIPWAVWQYIGGYGVASRLASGEIIFQAGVQSALGIKP